MKAEDVSIGALSKRTGVNIETIRYYERIGIMPKPRRSGGGYRMYGPDHVKRLTFVRRGRELGFSLDELRDLLRLVDGHSYTCAEVHDVAIEHVAEIRRKIADLRRLQGVMKTMVAECSRDRLPQCPIIDTLFDARPLSLTAQAAEKSS